MPRPEPYITEAVEKGLDRLGRKYLWRMNHAIYSASPPSCVLIRERLRDVDIFISDPNYAILVEKHAKGDENAPIDATALVKEFLLCYTPRRLHVVELVIQKLDPNNTGMILLDDLLDRFDALRHPGVVSNALEVKDVLKNFLASLPVVQVGGKNVVMVEDFKTYYLGISLTTPRDEDFELQCIRSYCLDRPALSLENEGERMRGSRLIAHQNKLLGEGRNHPLYTTTYEDYGKDEPYDVVTHQYGRSQQFTRNMPPRTGGATSMNM